jgi:uncharacterized membrane protein YcaP (DUF421 family)
MIDWHSLFVPPSFSAVVEIVIRGTIIYLFLFLVFRFLRRGAGGIGISDLLVVVIIADAAQNAMGGDYKTITEGVVLVLTIISWDYFLDWISLQVPALRGFIRANAIVLIEDGKTKKHNLRRQLITEEELLGEVRMQGAESFDEVKVSYMEADGHISVIKKKK